MGKKIYVFQHVTREEIVADSEEEARAQLAVFNLYADSFELLDVYDE